jgi:hypothetical protein
MAKPTSIRLERKSVEQIDFLEKIGFGGTSNIVRIALDRLYLHEKAEWDKKTKDVKTLRDLLCQTYGNQALEYYGVIFGPSIDEAPEVTTGSWMWDNIKHLISYVDLYNEHQVINPILQKDDPGWFISSNFIIFRYPDGSEEKVFKILND